MKLLLLNEVSGLVSGLVMSAELLDVDPIWDSLRDNPRFQGLVGSVTPLGLPKPRCQHVTAARAIRIPRGGEQPCIADPVMHAAGGAQGADGRRRERRRDVCQGGAEGDWNVQVRPCGPGA